MKGLNLVKDEYTRFKSTYTPTLFKINCTSITSLKVIEELIRRRINKQNSNDKIKRNADVNCGTLCTHCTGNQCTHAPILYFLTDSIGYFEHKYFIFLNCM